MKDPLDRPECSELLLHPFFKNNLKTGSEKLIKLLKKLSIESELV